MLEDRPVIQDHTGAPSGDAPVSGEKIRILLVDDHSIVRRGLLAVLHSQPDFCVVGQADNGLRAIQQVERLRPDVVLMDLRMPEMGGLEATQIITERYPQTRVIVLSAFDLESDVTQAIKAGATSYLLKDASDAVLFRAIREALQGNAVLSPRVSGLLLNQLRASAVPRLTSRELEILRLISLGHTNPEIAQQLQVGLPTVRTHVINIFNKLGVKDRSAAVAAGYERGLLSALSR
ncbi:MAG TPA: response regulator transcription factor [Meiothermus sp.]|jgi:DNA-binding NarL/FixJ family response regulator|nr:response regulator transcription factor [Meiothermus sp.]